MSFEKHDMEFLGGRRLRRPRMADWSRRMVAETVLTPADLIWPIFVIEGHNERQPIKTMPGVERLSINLAVEAAKAARAAGIPALALFPNTDPSKRSEDGIEATNRDNLVCRALSAIKDAVPDIGLVADVALDPYTSHGHDGVMAGEEILNDETVSILVKQALVQAQSGADVIAPSDMMDGRIGAIRGALDDAGFEKTILLSYAAKYASAFYGPFRDAVGSGARLKGTKLSYQMDPANSEDAIREVEQDLAEGADWIMVKPGMPYLDICRMLKDRFDVPVFAYQVSGEYAMIAHAAQAGIVDREAAMVESLMAFKRAGCSGILTYFALDMARKING
ncbi:porphobilinogen synthase [Pelagibacterium flavum]|uniref:Delta-aminolevulinic acid dehydratase n=1 Tax=Pelagibacterium flavum TaxID=2984530 RepID=A0ABY6IJH8_9HYPH|nr:porphobilinogen synthase [Pelagibacterium sp. YIM 151497]UYQ70759.1 porphobilinogen synthase [Pelagibacterium sp. YIM 151497]